MVKKKKKIKKEIYDDEIFNNHLKQITKKKEPKSPKQYFINTLIILGLITFFTGGWFPFGIYDKYTISEKEINFEWTKTYTPLFKWCSKYDNSNFLFREYDYSLDREPGLSLEKYAELPKDIKKCLEDKKHRIYLFNNQPWKVKANNLIKEAWQDVDKEVLIYSSNTSEDLIEIRNVAIYTNIRGWRFEYEKNFEDYLMRKQLDEETDNSQYFCLQDVMSTFCDSDFEIYQSKYFEDKKDKIFRLGFLTEKSFWLLSKACQNGCIANVSYVKENNINYVKKFEIIENILHKFDDYSDKKNENVIEYDRMIDSIKVKVKELTLKYNIPNWSININI